MKKQCKKCLAHNIGKDHICPQWIVALVDRQRRKGEKEIKKILEGEGNYWAVLCHSYQELICGVSASEAKAKLLFDAIKDCPAKHTIERCKVRIIYSYKPHYQDSPCKIHK